MYTIDNEDTFAEDVLEFIREQDEVGIALEFLKDVLNQRIRSC